MPERRNRIQWAFFALTLLAVFSVSAQPAETREQGIAAYWALDYETAVEVLTPLAESGDAEAAYYLGLMHDPVSQQVHGFNAKYYADYHSRVQALAWYEIAIEGNYKPALVRASFLMEVDRPLSRESRQEEDTLHGFGQNIDRPLLTTHNATRLNYGVTAMNPHRRIAYRDWHGDQPGLSPDEKFLYLRVVLMGRRRGVYISGVEKFEPMLETCGTAGDDLCYFYLGLIQLDAARGTYSGFDNKHIDAWVSFSLAEKMGNRHAAIYRYVIGESFSAKEQKAAQSMLTKKDR